MRLLKFIIMKGDDSMECPNCGEELKAYIHRNEMNRFGVKENGKVDYEAGLEHWTYATPNIQEYAECEACSKVYAIVDNVVKPDQVLDEYPEMEE